MTITNTNNITRVAGIALAVFAMLVVGIMLAPKAQAADLGLDEYSGGGGYFDQYSGGGGYYDQYSGGNGYFDQYSGGNGYFDQYSGGNPSYDSGYGGGSSGCGSTCGGGFGGSGFGGFGGFGGGSSGGSVFAPSTATANTSIYAPVSTCTAVNSCNTSYDDHSIFNAPTTVTISGGGSQQQQQQVVYTPVYQPQYPVYNTPVYPNYPTVYPQPVRQPYVSLSAAPYTGLDLGPVGTVLYWSFLVFWCLVAAYLIVYKRVQTKVVSGLNSFLFGAPATAGTHAKVVMPASTSAHKAYVAPAAHNDDAIDPFIASQISRNK